MGWLKNFFTTIEGAEADEWTLAEGIASAGAAIDETPIVPDECYIELYVDSLKLGKKRKFATTFDGVVYAFAETASEGELPGKFAAVTRPKEISNVGETSLNNVITFNTRLFKVIPWRGAPLDLELGLFSVKTGNIANTIAQYVVRVSNTASLGITATIDPFLPLVTEGLDMLAGQTEDVQLELAVVSSLTPKAGSHYALIRKPKRDVDTAELGLGADGGLRYRGQPVQESYCVFSIRPRTDNPGWGEIDALRTSFDELKAAILKGQSSPAEDALASFRRQVIVCSDLIAKDKMRLIKKAEDLVALTFGGAKIAVSRDRAAQLESLSFADLDLYGAQ